MRRATALVAGALCTAAPPAALAQIVPDAGSTLRDLEKPVIKLPRKPPPDIKLEAPERPALQPAPAVSFTLKSFRITGNTVFSESELVALVTEFVGKELGYVQLEQAAARVTHYYREHGYLVARAYLPAQEIRKGVVEIAVLEGRFGKVEIQNRTRIRDGAASSYLTPLQGRLIEERTFERKLLLLYDLPGIAEPGASLRPGTNVGESDLRVELNPSRLLDGSVELDNYGNRYTGGNRLSGQINVLSPLGLGDALTLRASKGDPNLDYGRVSYLLPIGGDGFKLGAGYSHTDYRLGRNFGPLDANGDAAAWNSFVSYPLVRSRAFNLYGQVGFERRDLEDRIDAIGSVTDRKVDVGTFTLSGDYRDGLGGGGVTVFAIAYGTGDLAIESPAAKAIDDATARTDGNYNKWNLDVLRLQALTERLSLYLSFAGQMASKNLDSSEKFLLGGASGVRAYPAGEAPSDSGYVLTTELRYAFNVPGFPRSLQLAGFVDTGGGAVNENPFTTGENRRRLSGGGVGVSWFSASDFQVRLMVAHKIGNARATSDTDQDTRAWLQAIKYF